MPVARLRARPAADARRRRRGRRGRGRAARAREPGRRARPDVAPAARRVRARDRRRRHRRRPARGPLRRDDRGPAARRHVAVRVVRQGPAGPAPDDIAIVARRPARRAGRAIAHRPRVDLVRRRARASPRHPDRRRRSRFRCRCPMARADLARRPERAFDDHRWRRPGGDARHVPFARRGHRTRPVEGLADAPDPRGFRRGCEPQARLTRARRQSGRRRTEGPCGIRADGTDRRPRAPGRAGGRAAVRCPRVLHAVRGDLHVASPAAQRAADDGASGCLAVRDDGFTRVSSDRGPVGDARRYPVPDEADANARVARRFRPYFDAIGEAK